MPQLETAYDTLLMQAMKKRLSGEVAGQSVRFADVPKRRAAGTVSRLPSFSARTRKTCISDVVGCGFLTC